jgi:acetyl/propionyl-CoA carboxylase alpha subunit
VQYDPMLAKLVASGESREAAIARAAAALRAFPVLGVRTNIPFLIAVLQHPAFTSGDVDTGFIDQHLSDLLQAPDTPETVRAAAAFVRGRGVPTAVPVEATRADPWTDLRGWGR